jgi:hypothetical protein
MSLGVVGAEYQTGYKILLSFSNNESIIVDLQGAIFLDQRKIFEPLKDLNYFKSFKIRLNTITWENEADFAPEFLLELGKTQQNKALTFA